MDETQVFLDGLFEEPSTILGFRNKLRFIRDWSFRLPLNSKVFKLTQNVRKDTIQKLRDLEELVRRQNAKR